MVRKRKISTLNNSAVDIAKQEILVMSYHLSCLLMRSSRYETDKVLKVFEYFSDIEKKNQKQKNLQAASERRRLFLESLRETE
ncbi:MAG: hypothetical protein SFU27_04050 [Thermonemataceae bacterium]|nr:hypothetical protein [Thermonemataceae bacterium]